MPKSNADPDDPFPGTLEFDEAMLDRIELLGFEYKLWAKGTAIVIDLIEVKGEGDPDYVAVPASDSRYQRTAENCIDMLFVNPSAGDAFRIEAAALLPRTLREPDANQHGSLEHDDMRSTRSHV